MDGLGFVEREKIQKRVRPQVLARSEQPEYQLQAEQAHGDSEIPVCDRL
jgi:hypothetical protein